jgi:hypothetical protein
MRILLLQPNTFTIRDFLQVPLAVMYIAAEAQRQGHDVCILDRNIETNSRKIINDFKSDVLGVTSLIGGMNVLKGYYRL